MAKLISLIALTAVFVLTFIPDGFGASQWLVRSIGSNSQTLWLDGEITKGDPKTAYHKGENRKHSNKNVELLDVSGWLVGGQGGSHDNYLVSYLSPTLRTADQIIVYYDLITGTVLSAERQTSDGTVTLEIDSLTLTPYCTGTYGCIS